MRMKSIFTVFFIFFLLPLGSVAQTLTASLSASVVAPGTAFQLTYSLKGGMGESFQPPSFSNFNVIGSSKMSGGGMTVIVNGKVVQDGGGDEKWIYTLAADKVGKYNIAPAKVKVNGQWISSNSLNIEISGKASSGKQTDQNNQVSGTGSSDDLFLKVTADKQNILQGEQLTLTYKIYTSIPVSQYAIQKLPSFSGFWSFDLLKDRKEVKQYTENVNGKKYTVAEIRKVALFPQKSGKLSIDPLEVECIAQVPVKTQKNNIFDQFFNDPFFRNPFSSGYQDVKRTLRTSSVSVQVSSLPAMNKPVDFSGLTGSFTMESGFDITEVKAHEAVNLNITISGTGNISLIDKLNIRFPSDFEVYDPQVEEQINASDVVGGIKKFTYLIIPRNPGNFTIEPVTFSYFDIARKEYITLSSGALKLKVLKGDPGAGNNYTGNKEDIKYINEDIKFIDLGKSGLKFSGSYFFGSVLYFILLAGIPLAFIVYLIVMRRRVKLRGNTALMKHRKATRVALKRLKTAGHLLKSGPKDKFYEEISKALWGYVSDKFSIPLAVISIGTIKEILIEKNIDAEIIEKVLVLLNNCEYARFAPSDSGMNMQTIYDEALKVIRETEEFLKH